MITLTETQITRAQDECLGYCLSCKEEQCGVEPNGSRYQCGACGAKRVYGIDFLIEEGLINVEGEEE